MKPSRKCCVPSCGETDDKKYSFFRFPDHSKTAKRWKTYIGLGAEFTPDVNTFVCVKHFTARDIAQQADRATGQKAKLRFGCTPRLLLEPIKAEIIDVDENGGTSGAPDERSTPTKPPSTLGPSGSVATTGIATPSTMPLIEKRASASKCPECHETFETGAHLLKHIHDRHKRKKSRLKTSELLKTLNPNEVLKSSDSECEYEISFNVKRIPKSSKRQKVDEASLVGSEASQLTPNVVKNNSTLTPVASTSTTTPTTNNTAIVTTSVTTTPTVTVETKTTQPQTASTKPKEAAPSPVILITVPPPETDEPPKPEMPKSKPIPTNDDLEDMLTSSLIMKPKISDPPEREARIMPVRRRNEVVRARKSNSNSENAEQKTQQFTNIMIASINSDGQIVEQCIETIENEGDDIIEEDYSEFIEETIEPTPPPPSPPQTKRRQAKVKLGRPPLPKPEVRPVGRPRIVRPQIIPAEKLAEMKENAKMAAAAAAAISSEVDSDDEAVDGAIRKCYECKMCRWMFLSTKKTKKHLTEVHRLTLADKDLNKFTKAYPYKNIKPTNGIRAYACSVCLRMYSNVNALKKHQIIQHNTVLGLGDKTTDNKAAPQNSNNIHVCHVCKKSFLDPENLRSHLLLHVDGKLDDSVYKCDQCGLGFEYEAALTKHTIENHATLRLYSCEYCNDAFASSADLYEHVQEHVSKNDQPTNTTNEGSNISELYLACPEDDCELAFKDSNSYYWHILYEHRKVYQDDPKFIEFLNMVDPDTLTQEEPAATVPQTDAEAEAAVVAAAAQVETQEKKIATVAPTMQASVATTPVNMDPNLRFTCKICDRKFTHLSFLKAHEMGKSRIKYECSNCDVKTFSKVCLVRHFNVYHDSTCERLHFCNECPKSFVKKNQLLKHMDRHQSKSKQQKIFHCNLDGCDRVFADATTYNFHLSRLHPNAKNVGAFECKVKGCPARFRHEGQLSQHVNEVHNTVIEEQDDKSGEIAEDNSKAEEFFFGHADKFVTTANGSMPDLNLSDSFMPEILNDVCNEVIIDTDL